MTLKKRIVIIGAGISGLSFAWYIGKNRPDCECILLEKKETPGGYMRTRDTEDGIVEKGPRVFKTSRSPDFLQLIKETGFSSELIGSDSKAKSRYLWKGGELKKVGSVALPYLFRGLMRDWKTPSVSKEETVWEFTSRRFGNKIADGLFDPLVLGIYAGDIKELSADAIFPVLKRWERENGSVIKGALSALIKKRKKDPRGDPPFKGLFSFKKGSGSFISHLEKSITGPIFYGEKSLGIKKENGVFQVISGQGVIEADEAVCAMPAHETASFIRSLSPEVAGILEEIPYRSIINVNVIFERAVRIKPGFGYLVPTLEKETILGVLFDSNIFPEQDKRACTKLTIMIRSEEQNTKEAVYRCLTRHLGIFEKPKEIIEESYSSAIPQYVIGHREKIASIYQKLPRGVHLIGNYLEGVSVNDSIKTARNLSLRI